MLPMEMFLKFQTIQIKLLLSKLLMMVGSCILDRVSLIKFLGVIIDENLS